MSRLYKPLLVALAIFVGGQSNASDYLPGELIIKYKDGTARTASAMDEFYSSLNVEAVEYFGESMGDMEHLYLSKDADVEAIAEEIMQDPMVEYAQPNYILSIPTEIEPWVSPNAIPCIPGFDIPGCDPNAKFPCLIPGIPFPPGCDDGGGSPGEPPTNPPGGGDKPDVKPAPSEPVPEKQDPKMTELWGMTKIHAPEAWANAKALGNQAPMVVAIIDTGIDYNHDDLLPNMWRKASDNNETGYDFVHNDNKPYDDHGHGSHTAGTIGAIIKNGVGVAGVAPNVRLMGIKFLSKSGQGSTEGAVKAIDYAVQNGANILSNSWGGRGDLGNSALSDAVKRVGEAGRLFVAAAGNDGKDNDADSVYPASFPHDTVLAVAATDETDKMAFFSNYGREKVDVAAPGVNILSTIKGNDYKKYSGTSMACPHVSGAAALIWSVRPDLGYLKIKQILMETAEVIESQKGKTVSEGRINVLKALEAAQQAI